MKTKFKTQRKGAVLMTVVVVSVMMAVIVAAAISLVSHTNTRTNDEYRKKQAYYVASSCVRAFVAETANFTQDATHDDAFISAAITQLKNIAKKSEVIDVEINKLDVGATTPIRDSQPRWNNAKCTIQVKPIDAECNNLRVISTGTYLGQTKVVVAYLSVTPLRMHTYTPKALEIIGTSGGNPDGIYMNMSVYGATGATDQASHREDTLYKFLQNQPFLWGNTDINGSMVLQNRSHIKGNPYYAPGIDDTQGCVLNVSRSLIFAANQPQFEPTAVKTKDMDNDPTDPIYGYNYVNVGEAMVMFCNNASVGWTVDEGSGKTEDYCNEHQVDTYTSFFYSGSYDEADTKCPGLLSEVGKNNPDQSEYWDSVRSNGTGQGDGNVFRGNIYTYSGAGYFNGDMVIAADTRVYGDIYCSGDIFLCDNDGWSGHFSCNKIHLTGGHSVYNCDRELLLNGETVKTNDLVSGGYLNGTSIEVVQEDNWSTNKRAKRPDFPSTTEDPYYYYPEHMMCSQNTVGTISTISGTIEDIYNGGTELDTSKIKAWNDPSFQNVDPHYFDGLPADVAANRRADYDNNGYPDDAINTVYTASNGITYAPDYIITDNCYIDTINNKRLMIDMDSEDAPQNLVVVLKDNGCITNPCTILVKNSTNPEDPDAKFVYFVSDSGFSSSVEDEYTQTETYHGYDHESFKESSFAFGGRSSTGCQQIIMDFEAFAHSSVFNPPYCEGGSLNPTQNYEGDDHQGYPLQPNNIIFLFAEGCTLHVGSNLLIQASVYMPRANYVSYNKGSALKVDPYCNDANFDGINVIGNVVCHNYVLQQGNNNTIVYNRVSPMSMLSYAKGLGEEHATESFQLIKYAAY